GKYLAVATRDQAVVFWDVAALRAAEKPFLWQRPVVVFCEARVEAFALSPDGKRLATAEEDASARVYEVLTGKLLLTIAGPSGRVFAVAYSPDGQLLATTGTGASRGPRFGLAGMDAHAVRLWDAVTGKEVVVGPELGRSAHTAAFHPSGRYLAAIHLPA